MKRKRHTEGFPRYAKAHQSSHLEVVAHRFYDSMTCDLICLLERTHGTCLGQQRTILFIFRAYFFRYSQISVIQEKKNIVFWRRISFFDYELEQYRCEKEFVGNHSVRVYLFLSITIGSNWGRFIQDLLWYSKYQLGNHYLIEVNIIHIYSQN